MPPPQQTHRPQAIASRYRKAMFEVDRRELTLAVLTRNFMWNLCMLAGGQFTAGTMPRSAASSRIFFCSFSKAAHLDLADPLAADVVLLAELLQRHRLVLEPPLGQDVPLALVQRHPSPRAGARAGSPARRARRAPSAWSASSSSSQSCHSAVPSPSPRTWALRLASPPAIRRFIEITSASVTLRSCGDPRHVLRAELALLDGADLVLGLAQVEEQLLLRRGGAHLDQAPRPQDVLLDRGADPPHRIGGEPEAPLGIEPLHRLHQPDVRLGDHLGGRQAVAAIAHGDLRGEPQVAGDQLCAASLSPWSTQALASMYSSSGSSIGNRRISCM